jgi:glycosyltransferase involved in cell wall biosynthesis
MACGTPILTSNVNGLKEIAGDAALLIDPGDTEQIANGMARILASSELREALSRKGLERSLLFSWDRCATQTLALLQKVACIDTYAGS